MLQRLKTYEQCNEAVEVAFEIARDNHRGQKINGSNTDFIVHPFAVAAMSASMGYPGKVVEASLLHDVIEKGSETPATLEEKGVGLVVIKAVTALTLEKEPHVKDDDYSTERHEAWLEEFYIKTRRNSIARAVRPLDQKDRYLRSNQKRFLERAEKLLPRMPSPAELEIYIAARNYLK